MKRNQFEIWIANLNPTKGSEQQGIRPVVILETNAVKSKGNTTIIAPLTSQIDPIFSYEVIIPNGEESGLEQDSKIKIRQIRIADISRLIKKIGNVPQDYRKDILNHIALVFDMEQLFSKEC